MSGPAASSVAACAAGTGARSAIGAGIGGRSRTRAGRTSSVFQRWYPPAAPAPMAASNDRATPTARLAPWRRGRPRGSKARCVVERGSRMSARSGEGREERGSRGSASATAIRAGSGDAGRCASRPGSSPADPGPGSIDGGVAGARSPSPPASMRRGLGQAVPPRTVAPASAPRMPGCRSCTETPALPEVSPGGVVWAGEECPDRSDPGPGASGSSSSFAAWIGASRHSPGATGTNSSSSSYPTGDRRPGSTSSRLARTGPRPAHPSPSEPNGWSAPSAAGSARASPAILDASGSGFMGVPGSPSSRLVRTGPRPAHPSPSEPNGWSAPSAAGSARASPAILDASGGGFMVAPRAKGAHRRSAPGAVSRRSRGGRAGTPGNPLPRSGSG